MLKKIAITGGLSCGKSTFCRFLKELGAKVVNADEIVHQLLHPNNKIGQQVIKLLGSDIVQNDQIDRSLIAKKVFNNPAQLKLLEAILHPAVMEAIEKEYQNFALTQPNGLFVAEIPLLFEINGEKLFHKSVVIASSRETTLNRFVSQTGRNDYDERMARQLPLEEKINRADYIVYNDGSVLDLKHAAENLYNKLTQSS